MQSDHPSIHAGRRRTHLATALALALGLGASQAMGATLVVQNCNDSGFGSLRAAVGSAASGDIVDMSGLTCTISLASSIVTVVDDLTIRGALNSKYMPSATINGQDQVTPIVHAGNGTLTLDKVSVVNGRFASGTMSANGGCVYSQGDVDLLDTSVKYCAAVGTANDIDAKGGAIYAQGNVTLDNSIVQGGAASNGGDFSSMVRGGGIYAGAGVWLENSEVGSSTASTSGSAQIKGGGIFAANAVVISSSTVADNSVTSAATGGGQSADGGGIFAGGQLVLVDATVADNHADNFGGGIYSDGGLGVGTVIDSSTIDGNSAGIGGGVFVRGSGTAADSSVSDSTISDNQGGGLFVQFGDVEITGSTISGNRSDGATAGVFIGGSSSSLAVIEQSTISGNEADAAGDSDLGAGLYLKTDAVIRNSTITGNIERNAGNVPHGAGISLRGSGVQLTLSSTIVSGNEIHFGDEKYSASDIGTGPNGSGTPVITGDHNLVGVSTISYPGDTIVSTQPGLGPLQDNGGPTWTHVPRQASPALDTGADNGFTNDQRGSGYARISGSAADIGSVESASDRIFADGFE